MDFVVADYKGALVGVPYPPNRGHMANALCAGLPSWNSNGTPEQQIQYLLDNGISFGQDAPTVAGFNANDELTMGQVASFLNRIEDEFSEGGWEPPVPITYTNTHVGPGPTCDNGFTVLAAHIDSADNDDGCRPPDCDFGRRVDGWCLPPANSDPLVIYVSGPADVDEDAGTASFRVALSHASSQTVAVTVVTSDGTATSGDDYTAVNRRVTFLPSDTLMTVTVPITDDTRDEPDETFRLQMSAPSSNAELSTTSDAEATIRDDDIPTVPGAPQNLTLTCSASGGAFTLEADWEPPSGSPSATGYQIQFSNRPYSWDSAGWLHPIPYINNGETNTTLSMAAPSADDYWVFVIPFRSGGVAEGTAGTQCRLPTPTVSLDVKLLTVDEGNSVPVTAILDSIPNGTAAVLFSTSGGIGGTGSCFNGANFSVDQSSFVFTNATTASITFTACDDSDTDDETIALRLTTIGISGLQLGSPTTVIVTITDDDTADCHTWQQFDPVRNTCVNRPFLS